MSQIEEKLENGVTAKLGGRYCYEDNGRQNYVDVFYTEQDKAYRAVDRETVVLTPTASWTHELGDGPWQKFHKNGAKRIVIAKDAWSEIQHADEVENFDYEKYGFVSKRTGQVTHYLDKPEPEVAEEKKLDNISEKVAKKMTTNSTLDMLKDAGIDATKSVGANQANELITSALKKGMLAMGLPKEYIETEAGHRFMKIMGPIAIHYMADAQSDFIDNMIGENASDNIKEGCKFATQKAMEDVMEPFLEFVAPLLKDLASLGMNSASAAVKNGLAAPVEEKAPKASAVEQLLKQKDKAKSSR